MRQPLNDSLARPPMRRAKTVHAPPKLSFFERFKRFARRIDVCWTFFFFLFLVCIGVVITVITQNQISRALRVSLESLHNARLFVYVKNINLLSARVTSIAMGYLTLHSQHSFAVNSEDNLATLCSILTMYDKLGILRLIGVGSLESMEAVACMHGDPVLGKSVLYGWRSENSVTDGSYLIDNSTYRFHTPLEKVYGGWPESANNITNSLLYLKNFYPPFQEVEAYYNGTIESINPRTMWLVRPGAPHIIYYMIPAGLAFRGLTLPPSMNLTDYVQVRLDASRILTANNNFYANKSAAAIIVGSSLGDDDPLVLSNNWGQQSVNDTQILTATGGTPLRLLTLSDINNTLMREAMKHINFQRLQHTSDVQEVDFMFNGAHATVTAMAYVAEGGLVLPLVMATALDYIAGPYSRIMDICNGVTAVGILLMTALFGWFVHKYFSATLENITESMLRNLRTGRRLLTRQPHFQLLQLTEAQQLTEAHNNAMRQLHEIDTFIPEAVRLQLLRSHDISLTSRMQLSTRSRGAAAAAHAHDDTLLEHLSTVIYITIKAPANFDRSCTDMTLLENTRNVPARQLLATVVANAARSAAALVNSGPFASPDDLRHFAAKVQELCEHHHGVVHRLCPDSCILHFHRRTRAHMSRNPLAEKSTVAFGAPEEQEEPELRYKAARDAHDALSFAFELKQWLRQGVLQVVPEVRALVDTSTFVCGHFLPKSSEQTMSVALGRDVNREVGGVPASIGVRVAMTAETATRVRGGTVPELSDEPLPSVRQIPVETLRIGRAKLNCEVVTLFEALPGHVMNDEPWQRYQHCCFAAFDLMVHGDYASALRVYKEVADISDLEPGLMPSSLRREAAHSDVKGGATSTQVERLMRECERRARLGITEGFCRARNVPLGIDAVLKQTARRSSLSTKERRVRFANFLNEDTAVSAQREGRLGLDGKNAAYTRTELRHVAILPETTLRTSHSGVPQSITDNWGVKWQVSKIHSANAKRLLGRVEFTGLSAAGDLCVLVFQLYREVPPLVSKALRDAPAGPMTDAMRSAVPVWQPSAVQRAAVRSLLDARLRLRHPHILTCLGYTMELEGGLTTALEYCKGGNLREVMARYDRLRVPTVCRAALSILLGLRYLHANAIVHGELRPECVLVCADGVCRLKGFYTDYALAHRVLCLPRTCYVSPEVAAGQPPTPASDVFGYGLVMLELVTQQLPWTWTPVVGEGPQRSAEDLAVLASAGGQAFSDLIASGRIAPAVERLEKEKARDVFSVNGLNSIRSCLAMNPLNRIVLNDLITVFEKMATEAGVKATPLHNTVSSSDESAAPSVFHE